MAKSGSNVTQQGNEIATNGDFTTADLRNITSIDDALEMLRSAGITTKSASDELGDGFTLLKDEEKQTLVGVPFLIIGFNESEGDYGRTMVTLRLITRDGRKVVINDGSTGLRAQLIDYLSDHDTVVGMAVERGLRASDYKYCRACSHVNRKNAAKCKVCESAELSGAQTFYLDTSRNA